MVSAAPLIALGEVHTCLLPSSTPLARYEASRLLALVPGSAVRWRERPGRLAISPAVAVGVDCDLVLDAEDSARGTSPTAVAAGTVRAVGTVATRVVLAGGVVLQSSVHTTVARSPERRRQPWSHYLGRRGMTEVISRIPERSVATAALAAGHLGGRSAPDTLDLTSIGRRLLNRIRVDPELDQDPPIRASTTRLRWAASIGGSTGPSATLRVDDEVTRSLRLVLREESDIEAAQRFCEDVAAHDWLLTVLAAALDEAARFGAHSAERHTILSALLGHFSGLWMPGAHTPASMRTLWTGLQSDPGFTRQWNTLLERLNAGIAIATLDALAQKNSESGR